MKHTESSQIGGKGTIRRKKKGSGGHIVPKMTNEEKQYNKILQRINNLINEINEEYSETWCIFMDEWWEDTSESFIKKDFIKKEYIEFDSKFINPDSKKMLFKIDYKLYKNTFSEQGYDKMMYYIEDLEIIINKKEYLDSINESESDSTAQDIKDYYLILKLDKSTIPTKSELKHSYYKESRENHPDKHPEESEKYTILFKNINKAYKSLLNYYYKKPSKEQGDYESAREKAAAAAEARNKKSNDKKSNDKKSKDKNGNTHLPDFSELRIWN